MTTQSLASTNGAKTPLSVNGADVLVTLAIPQDMDVLRDYPIEEWWSAMHKLPTISVELCPVTLMLKSGYEIGAYANYVSIKRMRRERSLSFLRWTAWLMTYLVTITSLEVKSTKPTLTLARKAKYLTVWTI